MSTITTKRLPDPDDDSIENSLRRFESKLRFWSPVLLGPLQSIAPFAYSGAIAFSTILGYVLFLLPSLLLATLFADVLTSNALFTTVTTVLENTTTIVNLYTTNVWVPFISFMLVYIALVITYEPIEPNGTSDALFGTSEWKRLQRSIIVCSLLFVTLYAFSAGTTLGYIGMVLSAWWVMRRIAFTVLFDDTRYVVSAPVTETLLFSRIPTITGGFLLVIGMELLGIALLSTPFVSGVLYLLWRRTTGNDTSQELPTVRMHKKSGLPTDFVEDFGASNAYRANADDELFRNSVEKFNSLLETEIDTTRRVSIPDGRLSKEHIRSAISQAEEIHSDFNEVSYRPERFDDTLSQIQEYGKKYIQVLDDEGIHH